jgi:hypothetical protein
LEIMFKKVLRNFTTRVEFAFSTEGHACGRLTELLV